MNPRVACVILAAGGGARFGGAESKLLLPFQGKPLLQHVIDAAAASHALQCTLVVGAAADKVLCSVDTRRCSVIANDDWRSGITSSIRAGLRQHLNDDACTFMVGDQPFVTTADLNRLIARFAERRDAIVALRVAAIWGTPVLFPRSDYRALLKLTGDRGAKQYASRAGKRLEFVEAVHPDAFSDVDTPEDYSRL
jgi:molybdenum cofactor cytidylyltransferase